MNLVAERQRTQRSLIFSLTDLCDLSALDGQFRRNCTNKRAPRCAVPLCTLAWLPQHSRRPAVIRPALTTSNRNRRARCFGGVLVGFRKRRPTSLSQD